MVDRHIKKDKSLDSDDPIDAYRSIHFKIDNRTNEEKVKDTVAEAGHETRSVNQVVKLVNMSLSEKVKRLEKLKQDSKRFEEELNMFSANPNEKSEFSQLDDSNVSKSPEPEVDTVSSDLLLLINKHGIQKLTIALDEILTQMKSSEKRDVV